MTEEVYTEGSPTTYTFEGRVCAFWSKVDRSGGPDTCWTWTGAVTSKWHYGCFSLGKGQVRGAHKIAWLLTNGDTNGLCVLHRCDNRVCCNPGHLFLGTKQDNSDDKVQKGRQVGRQLTTEQVHEARALFGVIPQRQIARQLNVSTAVISKLYLGRTYKEIPHASA